MSFPTNENDQELEAMLTETLGPPPGTDIDAWRKRYPSALAWLNPQRIGVLSQRRKRMQRIILLAATTAVAICVWFGLSHFDTTGTGTSAFAQTVEQIIKAKTVRWKGTLYLHATSKDGKRTWLTAHTVQQVAKLPGLIRCDPLDSYFSYIRIDDHATGKELSLNTTKKRAFIKEFLPWKTFPGPWDWVQDTLSKPNLQWVEKRTTATGEVNVFRYAFKDEANHRNSSQDFWINAKTKQLVEVHSPGADIFDPEKDPVRNNPRGEKAYSEHVMGTIDHDFVFDAEVDDSLFSLKPPEGYVVEVQSRPHVTEQEMVHYLGVVADFNNQVFPDQDCPLYDITRVNETLKKTENDRTAAERKFMEAFFHYEQELSILPLRNFLDESVRPKSFRYLGKGVKLGDKDRIVCWYKLTDAKDPNTYRVVYGDLSVKDVAAKDLPLPVEP
jgi:outer membrane lipoprotein-sorting protein